MISNQKSKAHKGTAVIAAAFVLFAAMPVYAGTPDAPTVTVTPGTAATDWTNQSATVSFSVQDYKVTAGPCTNGTVELSADRAKATDTVTVTPKPTDGFMIEEVFVNGASIGTATSFEMPAQDTTVTAKFKKNSVVVVCEKLNDGYWRGGGSYWEEYKQGVADVRIPYGKTFSKAVIEVSLSVSDHSDGSSEIAIYEYANGLPPKETVLERVSNSRFSGTITRTITLRPEDNMIRVSAMHIQSTGRDKGSASYYLSALQVTFIE